MRVRQCTLSNQHTITVGWIDAKAAKVGNAIRFKDEPDWWWVDVVGSVEKESSELHHTWHNDI
jgi:hypothetical protein